MQGNSILDVPWYVSQQDKQPMTPIYESELTSLIYADAIDKRLEIVALIHSRDCASHSSTGRQDPEWKPSPPGDTIADIMEERGISRLRLGCMLDLRERSKTPGAWQRFKYWLKGKVS